MQSLRIAEESHFCAWVEVRWARAPALGATIYERNLHIGLGRSEPGILCVRAGFCGTGGKSGKCSPPGGREAGERFDYNAGAADTAGCAGSRSEEQHAISGGAHD